MSDRNLLPERAPAGNWVQTERKAHEAWAALIAKAPKAAQIMHILTANVGEHNAVVISQKNLMRLTGASRRTVQRALSVLQQDKWIEVRQIGQNGTVNAHVINDRVAWSGKRDGIRYSLFSATIVLSDDEQPDRADLGKQGPLRELPSLFHGERQLPTGDGLPPPSEPSLPGMDPDLPATKWKNSMRFFLVDRSIPALEPKPGSMLLLGSSGTWSDITPSEVLTDEDSPEVSEEIFMSTLEQLGASMP